jgi:hypothetical protein
MKLGKLKEKDYTEEKFHKTKNFQLQAELNTLFEKLKKNF